MSPRARVVAIVVNWNGGAANVACLESLAAQGDALASVLFVDNASTDGSRELVVERYPELEVLANATNEGYAGGNNRGIQLALERGADAVLVVNNDVVLDPGVVRELTAALEREPTVGLVGPRVVYARAPDVVWAAGGRLTWRQNLTTLLGQGERDDSRWQSVREVDYVPGCCLLARRAVLEATGGFEESYFAYTEDVDLGVTARELGWRSLVVGGARVVHDASTSTGGGYNPRRKFMMGLNSIRFLRRHASPGQWLSFCLFDVGSLPFVWLAGVPRGRGKAVAAKAWGIWCGLRGRRVEPRLLERGATWLW